LNVLHEQVLPMRCSAAAVPCSCNPRAMSASGASWGRRGHRATGSDGLECALAISKGTATPVLLQWSGAGRLSVGGHVDAVPAL
jgi:hypothetical protein